MRANRDFARIFDDVATPSRSASSTAARLNTGSAPGRPSTIGSVSELGGAPNSVADAEKYGRTDAHPADQRMIGDTIYGGDWGRINLGNTQPDDGYVNQAAWRTERTLDPLPPSLVRR